MGTKEILLVATVAGLGAGYGMANRPPPRSLAETEKIEHSVYYSACNEARAAGVAPIHAGQPGYRSGLDGDGDGVACEPYRGM